MTQPKTFAPELIACIAEGRHPRVTELNRVADRIQADLQLCRVPFAQGSNARLLVVKAAHAALVGGDSSMAGASRGN
ncbi:hypothetical protein M9978_09310 [Sphingomonas sp. MG17]|jgi:hypothetical protein|uniref:Uncharacterized protein n=1 Tax=Sphingomonas tagetis TaxID=2949092 RepID=A0A9X2HMV6_9SPHN|nr:hypothetical protein [Sphingomonas tagetis]MCP3730624.1 hypothetical protein [Sphingomonas tagetis]